MHALIIEDEREIASFIEEGLRDIGFTSFDVAAREDEAIAAAEARCPDFITADDRLTDGTGIRAVQEICGSRAIPVLFIAGDDAAISRAFPEAVIVPKPFLISQLCEAVEQARAEFERLS